MTEKTATVREARAHLAEHINRAEEGPPTVITRNGVPVAAVVPITDFEALEEAADLLLSREAEAEVRVPVHHGSTAAAPGHQPTRCHAHPDRADRTG
ncbi:type II toxin-antitoxin system Phd/YefM family antitoxin [Streptomyces sp. NPDC005760]|uniref:type II toxin-antitoxin system Phd/YefM family antitoxin n=1 Tax=Streptomyces sp. NPDC005760 TaxID=3156718 RepID=UPI0033C95F73